MYYLYLFILLMASGLNAMYAQSQTKSSTIRVMSFNIRYDNPGDSLNSWDYRKDRVVNLIRFFEPDFIGTQEALIHQVEYLEEHLPSTGRIGVGRADGEDGGELSAILYNKNRFELVAGSDSTIWLSETPAKPSKSWDAALPRILTFGKFRDKSSGRELYVFNTHFDHIGKQARSESARLILKTIKEVAGDQPVVLTGDFNVVETDKPYQILEESFLRDAFYASQLPSVGPEFTFSGFDVPGPEKKRRIDFIFVNDVIDVTRHAILSLFRGDSFPSDHLPVIADLIVKP
jgi:endonuclease/exonuclease/phosphatase family metal-dependent hydrolase